MSDDDDDDKFKRMYNRQVDLLNAVGEIIRCQELMDIKLQAMGVGIFAIASKLKLTEALDLMNRTLDDALDSITDHLPEGMEEPE